MRDGIKIFLAVTMSIIVTHFGGNSAVGFYILGAGVMFLFFWIDHTD